NRAGENGRALRHPAKVVNDDCGVAGEIMRVPYRPPNTKRLSRIDWGGRRKPARRAGAIRQRRVVPGPSQNPRSIEAVRVGLGWALCRHRLAYVSEVHVGRWVTMGEVGQVDTHGVSSGIEGNVAIHGSHRCGLDERHEL